MLWNEAIVEGDMQASYQFYARGKDRKHKLTIAMIINRGFSSDSNSSNDSKSGKYPLCQHCGKRNLPHLKWWGKNDMRCIKYHKHGHSKIIFK